MPVTVAVGTLKRRDPITADDFAELQKLTKRTAKATIPSPTVNHFFTGDAGLKNSPYAGDRKRYLADIGAIYRQEIAMLAQLGCKYLQVDEVPLAVLCDPKNQAIVEARGENAQQLIDDYIDLINDSIRDRPKDMTLCVHLCRGNQGHGQADGGYDPVAERLFQRLRFDGFFLEYDTPRAGDFKPLRFVPKDKVVVLGLMSTKLKELEPVDELKRRVDEAARHVDMARLCISPQCGFASSAEVDRFTAEDEERKLATSSAPPARSGKAEGKPHDTIERGAPDRQRAAAAGRESIRDGGEASWRRSAADSRWRTDRLVLGSAPHVRAPSRARSL